MYEGRYSGSPWMSTVAVATGRCRGIGSQMNPQKLRRPLQKRTETGTADSDADWTIESGVALCFLEEVCALWWRLTGQVDLVGITGLCGLVLDELLLVIVRDHGCDTGQYTLRGIGRRIRRVRAEDQAKYIGWC